MDMDSVLSILKFTIEIGIALIVAGYRFSYHMGKMSGSRDTQNTRNNKRRHKNNRRTLNK